jgi:hypothetical protein
MAQLVELRARVQQLVDSAEWKEYQQSIVLTMELKRVKARAMFDDGRIRVLKGSTAVRMTRGSMPDGPRQLRDEMIRTGALRDAVFDYEFTKDWLFDDPSPAACVVAGASKNGLDCWIMPDGRTLGECIHKYLL